MIEVIPLVLEEAKNLDRLLLDEALEILLLAPANTSNTRIISADKYEMLISNLEILRKGMEAVDPDADTLRGI